MDGVVILAIAAGRGVLSHLFLTPIWDKVISDLNHRHTDFQDQSRNSRFYKSIPYDARHVE